VALQRYYSSAWHTVAIKNLSSTSTTTFSVKPGSRAYFSYRIYKSADSDHGAVTSATVRIHTY
jgi:hypothetical protein